MKVGQITVENITFFESFLLPQAAMNFRSGTDGLFLGLMWKKTAVGALAGTIEQDTFVIDSFYVAPEYRRKGGATVLMDKLCDLLKKQVFVITADLVMTGDEQSGMDGFLSRYGFRQDFERMGKTYQTTLQHMKECKAFQGTYKGPDHSFAQCDKNVLSVEARHAAYMGAPCTEKSLLEFVQPKFTLRRINKAFKNGSWRQLGRMTGWRWNLQSDRKKESLASKES